MTFYDDRGDWPKRYDAAVAWLREKAASASPGPWQIKISEGPSLTGSVFVRDAEGQTVTALKNASVEFRGTFWPLEDSDAYLMALSRHVLPLLEEARRKELEIAFWQGDVKADDVVPSPAIIALIQDVERMQPHDH